MSAVAAGTPPAASAPRAAAKATDSALRFVTLWRQGAREAAQWRLLLLWLVFSALPTALFVLPLWQALSALLDNSLHADELTQSLNIIFLGDLLGQLRGAGAALGGAGTASALLWLALLPWLHGMFVAAARAPARLGLGELMHGGLRMYWRMLRLGVAALLPLGVALGLSALAMKGVSRYAEHAILESDVSHLRWAARALALLLLALADAGVDAGRAQFVLYPSRRSAFLAWWRGFKLVLRRPGRALGLFVSYAVLGLLGAALLAWVQVPVPGGSVGGFLLGLLVSQAIVACLAWMHYAQLFGLCALARAQRGPWGA